MKILAAHIQAQIARLDAQIVQAQSYVAYWTAYATSQTNYARNVYNYVEDHLKVKRIKLKTEAELEKAAFETALVHIRRIEEMGNAKAQLLEDGNNWQQVP